MARVLARSTVTAPAGLRSAGLRLRAMRRRDLDAVHAIETEVYRRGWSREVFRAELDRRDGRDLRDRRDVPDRRGRRDRRDRRGRRDRGDGRDYLVATVPDGRLGLRRRIVGYGGAMLVVDEVHVTTLVVAAGARRQGVASVLLDALLDRAVARGATAATLEVRAGNTAARQLYRRFGFAPVGTRRGYYPDGAAGDPDANEDAVIMWLHDLPERR